MAATSCHYTCELTALSSESHNKVRIGGRMVELTRQSVPRSSKETAHKPAVPNDDEERGVRLNVRTSGRASGERRAVPGAAKVPAT